MDLDFLQPRSGGFGSIQDRILHIQSTLIHGLDHLDLSNLRPLQGSTAREQSLRAILSDSPCEEHFCEGESQNSHLSPRPRAEKRTANKKQINKASLPAKAAKVPSASSWLDCSEADKLFNCQAVKCQSCGENSGEEAEL